MTEPDTKMDEGNLSAAYDFSYEFDCVAIVLMYSDHSLTIHAGRLSTAIGL